MRIKFEISAGLVNNQGPTIDLFCNNELICVDTVLQEQNFFQFDVQEHQINTVIFVHKNKTDNDTVLDNGKIIADKFLQIQKIWVDDILVKDYVFGVITPIYSASFLESNRGVDLPDQVIGHNLYFNGQIKYVFDADFFDTLDNKIKDTDIKWAGLHHNDQDVYLGYNQDTNIENEILQLLEKNGYHVAR